MGRIKKIFVNSDVRFEVVTCDSMWFFVFTWQEGKPPMTFFHCTHQPNKIPYLHKVNSLSCNANMVLIPKVKRVFCFVFF